MKLNWEKCLEISTIMLWAMYTIILLKTLEKVNWFILDPWKYGEPAKTMTILENMEKDSSLLT